MLLCSKGLAPANRRYLRPPSTSVSCYNPADRLKAQGLCQGHPSSWRRGWTWNGGLLALGLHLSSLPLPGFWLPRRVSTGPQAVAITAETPPSMPRHEARKRSPTLSQMLQLLSQAWGLGRLAQVPSACRAPSRVLLSRSSFCWHKLGGHSTHLQVWLSPSEVTELERD